MCQSSLMVHHVKLAPAGQGGGADVAKPCESQTTSVVLQNTQGPGAVFFSCLLSVLRVLLNITHESRESCQKGFGCHAKVRRAWLPHAASNKSIYKASTFFVYRVLCGLYGVSRIVLKTLLKG